MVERKPLGDWAPQAHSKGRYRGRDAMARFREKCRFEPETGCVVWIGGRTMGRGHHVPYPSFWYEGRRWFGHRWAAKFIHGIDIDDFQVDHCCPNIAKPNTMCVQHLQAVSARLNRQLQETRKLFVHLQVGLVRYSDIYGHDPDMDEVAGIPFYRAPAWLTDEETPDGDNTDDCPF